MSLTWHIVRKDLRRLRLPVILWLALVLAHTGLLLLAGTRAGDPANPASFEGLRYFANTWGVIIAAVGFVLAAWLVMEDSLVSTQAFWPTRPISAGRLFAAKALGAFLMFSVGPVLVLIPVWLGCGFSMGETARAAGILGTTQGFLSVAAFAIAGVTATSGQFLVRAVGAVVVIPLGVGLASGLIWPANLAVGAGVAESRTGLAWGLLAAATLAGVVHQYLTRRTFRTWVIAGTAFALILAVRFTWFWDATPLFRSEAGRSAKEPAEVRAVAVVNPRTDSLAKPGYEKCRIQGELTGIPALAYVRINASLGEWTQGNERFALKRRLQAPGGSGRPPESVIRQVAGLPASGPVPAQWELAAEEPAGRVDQARAGARQLEVAVNLTLMRGRVLGELPLRVGAELQLGASRTRVTRVERTEAGLVVRLQNRDGQIYVAQSAGTGPARRSEDAFVLVHRPTGFAQVLATTEIGSVSIHSIAIGERAVTLIPPTREQNGQTEEIPGWENDAVLIQIRFHPEFTFIRPVTVDPFAPAPRS